VTVRELDTYDATDLRKSARRRTNNRNRWIHTVVGTGIVAFLLFPLYWM